MSGAPWHGTAVALDGLVLACTRPPLSLSCFQACDLYTTHSFLCVGIIYSLFVSAVGKGSQSIAGVLGALSSGYRSICE